MRNRLRGTLLSAAASVAVAAAPAGAALGQDLPTVTPGVEPTPGQRYAVPQGALPPAGPAELGEALPPGLLPPANGGGPGGPGSPSLLPDSLRPYPRISPYDHRFDQFTNEGGLWMRTANNSPRKWYGGASYISAKFRSAAQTTIGSRRTLDEALNELFNPTQTFGFNNPTFGINTLDGALVTLPWVKAQMIPVFDAAGALVGLEYSGLAFVREDFDDGTPDAANIGLQANRTRLVAFYDADVDFDTTTLIFDPTTAGESVDGVTLDQIGFEPITGAIFGEDEGKNLLPNYDPIIGTRYSDADNPGFRLRFGWEEADQGGFEWTFDYISEEPDVYARGNRVEAERYFENQQLNLNGINGVPNTFVRQDLNFRPSPLGVIVVDANPDLFFGNGVLQPPNFIGQPVTNQLDQTLAAFTYDLLYEHEFSSQQTGTEFSYIFTPMLRRGRFRVRPSAGLRFNYIEERYKFTGLDSGAIYVQDSLGEYTTPSATNPAFATPTTGTILDPATGLPGGTFLPYRSDLDNTVRTYLFGPQIGLHADVEGKFLTVRGHVKTGVAGLAEKISVRGQGFNLNQHTTGDLRPFNSDEQHGRVSPFLDANIRGEVNLFPYVPVVNRFSFLKNARFTGGFSVTTFWEVSRPLDTVVWREANNGNPRVNSDPDGRSKLYFTNWDMGVVWNW
ncbi:MAG: hypothetical protein AAF907_02075 [Planctomycetota bacterium]